MSIKRATKRHADLKDVVATRRLRDLKSGEELIVRIGRPRKRNGNWECPFHVGGTPTSGVELGHGVDALQALIQALDGIRSGLAGKNRMEWIGGEPGDAGIPRFVPMFYGRDFAARIERLIDNEISRFATLAQRRALGRSRRRAPRRKAPTQVVLRKKTKVDRKGVREAKTVRKGFR
jgi:hypothetical protein